MEGIVWDRVEIDADEDGEEGYEDAALRRWWKKQRLPTCVPVEYTGFVPLRLPLSTALPTDVLPLKNVGTALHAELEAKAYIVFYVRGTRNGHLLATLLGGYPTHLLKQIRALGEPLYVGDLWHSRCFDEWSLHVGVQSDTHWLPIPCEGTVRTCNVSGDSWTVEHRLKRRLDLMLVWWKQRLNGRFIQVDGPAILAALHCEGGEMDLGSDEGRQRELSAYWLLVFVCSHEPWLWDVRAYWERALLEWRMASLYCKEYHMAICLQRNAAHCPIRGNESQDQVDPRELLLYGKRHPGVPLPRLWITVDASTVPPALLSNPHYDVERGTVTITHRDFVPWIWHQMVSAALAVSKRLHVSMHHVEPGDPIALERCRIDADVYRTVAPLIKRCEDARDEERARIAANALRASETAELPGIDTPPLLMEAARTRFPMCMSQHVFRAFEQGRHPKNHSRVSLAMFLLKSGYTVDQVDAAMFALFASDDSFVSRYPRGGWNETSYRAKFGLQTLHLNKTQPAYACETLIEATKRGQDYGCPFARTGRDSKEVPLILQWSRVELVDIEDIAGVSYPQGRCQRDFNKRAALPDITPPVIKHPNAFMRRRNQAPPPVVVATK